jgi:hypothetical protein
VLFDGQLKLIAALENALGRELVQQSSNRALHDVLFLRAARGSPGSKGLVLIVHSSVQ